MRRLASGYLAAFILIGLAASAPAVAGEEEEQRMIQVASFLQKKDYPRAVKSFLPLLLAKRQPQSDSGRDCIAALSATDAGTAGKSCASFAEELPEDAQANLSFGLALLLGGQPHKAQEQFVRAQQWPPDYEVRLASAISLFTAIAIAADTKMHLDALAETDMSDADREIVTAALDSFKVGDFTTSADKLKQVYDGGVATGTMVLMLYVAQKRAGLTPTVSIADAPDHVPSFRMLTLALRGEKPPKEAFRTYQFKGGEGESKYPRIRFFLGEAALIQGDKAEAIRYFKKAAAASKLEQVESELAAAELKRLEAE
jgi:tetratricopeptide (TPR) repeat protein